MEDVALVQEGHHDKQPQSGQQEGHNDEHPQPGEKEGHDDEHPHSGQQDQQEENEEEEAGADEVDPAMYAAVMAALKKTNLPERIEKITNRTQKPQPLPEYEPPPPERLAHQLCGSYYWIAMLQHIVPDGMQIVCPILDSLGPNELLDDHTVRSRVQVLELPWRMSPYWRLWLPQGDKGLFFVGQQGVRSKCSGKLALMGVLLDIMDREVRFCHRYRNRQRNR